MWEYYVRFAEAFFNEVHFHENVREIDSMKNFTKYFSLFLAHYSLHYRTTHLRDDRLQ